MFHHIFLACEEENGDTFEQADMGTGSLLTQWMAKYGYVPIVLIGVAGLALEIGTGEWQGGETVVAKTPVVVENSRCGRDSCCRRGCCCSQVS